jgi:elongation factor G
VRSVDGIATARIRNVAVIGHGGTGKTTLVEALLFEAGAIDRLGRVDDGNATTDYDPEEIRRKHSINLALAPLQWRGYKVNLLDVPGYPDFVGEVASALRVVEGALLVVDGVSGVEVQTERGWQLVTDRGIRCIAVVNRLDRENSSFTRAVESLQSRFSATFLPIHLPIGTANAFSGIVDLLSMQAFVLEGEKKATAPIPADLVDQARTLREKIVEVAAETDDTLVEKYLESGELSPEEVMRGLRAAVLSGRVVPVVACSALRTIGVASLLDAIVSLLPSPAEAGKVAAVRPDGGKEIVLSPAEEGPLTALVFKTMADPYVGKLSYFRVYTGVLHADSQVYNASKGKVERVGTLFFLRGKHQEPTNQVVAGDIGVVAKLTETGTGDTLASKEEPLLLPSIEFPRPLLSMAVEPKSKADEDKMGTALHRLAEEDPTLHVHRDVEMKQTIVSGMGEVHLEVVVERLKRKFGVDVTLSLPRVPYRETIKGTAKAQGRYVRQTGGRGQYGVCFIEVEPLPRGAGFEFVDKIFGAAIPNQFIPSVEKGVRKAMEEGVLAGYPLVDLRVILYDGKHHPVDSSDIAFQIAGSLALKEAVQQAGLVLLEPIMSLEVRVPDDLTGDVIGDLNARRGRILGMEPQGDGTTVVKALVPQAEVLRYSSDLRSLTGGRGSFEMAFSHYEEVPPHVAEKVIAEARRQKAEVEGGRS